MSLAHPAWLILLVLLPLLGAAAVAVARLRRKQWAAFVAPRLRPSLLKRSSPLARWFALGLLLAACAALIAALARPQADAGTRTEKSIGRNVLVALDLSRSMRVQDVKPDRLTQAKTIIYELIDAMPNERIGLIGFAGNAYLYAPLTVDHRAVRETVEQIDETWAPLGGSNLSEALQLAIETLRQTGQKNNALVILSDGEKHDRDTADMIAEAERAGVYILAIGIGTEDGDYIPNSDFPGNRMVDRNGNPILSRLQPDVMRQLATETRGRFAVAGSGVDVPGIVKAAVLDMDSFEIEGRERRVSIEFYQWLLLPAILLLMASIIAGTRWRGVKPALIATAWLAAFTPPASRADATADARSALENGRFAAAQDAYHKLASRSRLPERRARYRLGEATAAYRAGNFKHARSAFSSAILSEQPQVAAHAHLGLGNTLFQLGWKALADQSYPADPSNPPDLPAFDTKVRDLLARLKQHADPDATAAGGYSRIETMITNWTDAIRHFDSSLSANPNDPASRQNRQTTLTYLKRLQELIDEDNQQTEQQLPEPSPGEGEPKADENSEPGDQDCDKPGSKPGGKNPGNNPDQEPQEPQDEGRPQDRNKPGKDQDKKDKKENDDRKPGETPQDRARRILKENADLEKGPLTPGRREFRAPEKDW